MTHSMEKYVREKITTEQWSPQQIAGYAKSQGIPMVSHERIYQLIRKDKAEKGVLWKHTRHRLKHRKKPVTGKQIGIKTKYPSNSVRLLLITGDDAETGK
jgi:IS30 family transposase